MRALSKEEKDRLASELVSKGEPVRFLSGGCACDISTGHICKKGTNVINQPVYWRFSKELALEIANLTGTKAVFCN